MRERVTESVGRDRDLPLLCHSPLLKGEGGHTLLTVEILFGST